MTTLLTQFLCRSHEEQATWKKQMRDIDVDAIPLYKSDRKLTQMKMATPKPRQEEVNQETIRFLRLYDKFIQHKEKYPLSFLLYAHLNLQNIDSRKNLIEFLDDPGTYTQYKKQIEVAKTKLLTALKACHDIEPEWKGAQVATKGQTIGERLDALTDTVKKWPTQFTNALPHRVEAGLRASQQNH